MLLSTVCYGCWFLLVNCTWCLPCLSLLCMRVCMSPGQVVQTQKNSGAGNPVEHMCNGCVLSNMHTSNSLHSNNDHLTCQPLPCIHDHGLIMDLTPYPCQRHPMINCDLHRIHFDDLHNSGLYSWQYLYDMGRHKYRRMRQYIMELREKGMSRDPPGRVKHQTKTTHQAGQGQEQEQDGNRGSSGSSSSGSGTSGGGGNRSGR